MVRISSIFFFISYMSDADFNLTDDSLQNKTKHAIIIIIEHVFYHAFERK